MHGARVSILTVHALGLPLGTKRGSLDGGGGDERILDRQANTTAAASSSLPSASGSTLRSSGVTEEEHIFDRVVTPNDVEKLNRLPVNENARRVIGMSSLHVTDATLSLRMPMSFQTAFTEDDSSDHCRQYYLDSQAGNVSTDELGKAAERWPSEGTRLRGFCEPETWEKLKKCLKVVMFVATIQIQARLRSLHPRKRKWNHGSASTDKLGKAAESWPAKSFALSEVFERKWRPRDQPSGVSELEKVVERQWLASNQFYHITPKLKKCLIVVKFVVRIQKVGIRGRRMRKHHLTHGRAATDELGIDKGTGFGFHELVRRRKLDKNVWRSTFTEEDSFYPRHKHLHSIAKVEKAHSNFRENVEEWIAIRKQYGGGLHHKCVQQAVCKLIGRNGIKQMIMEKILLDRNGGSNYTVICIDAGRGHAKTSLLRILYNDQQLMDAFDKRIWVQMSDKLDILTLLRRIVEFTMNDHCNYKPRVSSRNGEGGNQ